jgi:hypothetical protein
VRYEALFVAALVVHAIVAFAGVGLVGAIPIVARFARHGDRGLSQETTVLGALLRYAQGSLVIVGVSGVVIEFATGGAFHSSPWFRGSVALFLFVGFAQGQARRALRKGTEAQATLRRVERWGWTMCVAASAIAVLMVLKP